MQFNEPNIKGDDPRLEPSFNDGTFTGQKVYYDDLNIGRRDVQVLRLGDLWRPWYYFKEQNNPYIATNCQQDTPSVSLLYDITLEEHDPKKIGDCCFFHAHRFGDGHHYDNPSLAYSMKTEGQQYYIDVVTHYTADAPNDVKFKDGSKPSDLMVFEGHHRKHNALIQGMNIKTRVYHFYDIQLPLTMDNLQRCYNSNYDRSFWSPYQFEAGGCITPWFTLNHYAHPETSHKFAMLRQCFDFLKSKNLTFKNGIDVGGGEGLYAWLATKEFNIPVVTIDSERGQILRAFLAKMIFNISNVYPRVALWENVNYDEFDFGMLLSISHHMKDWPAFLLKFAKNKKAIIVEVRFKAQNQRVFGSIKGFQTHEETEKLFQSLNMNFQRLGVLDGDRNFYCLWR